MRTIEFNGLDRGNWIKTISNVANSKFHKDEEKIVLLKFVNIDTQKMESIHLVTLACLIEFLDGKNYSIRTDALAETGNFLFTILKFNEYWGDRKQNYTRANNDLILNLWRIVDEEKETHSLKVHNYLRQHFFKRKDLSAVKNSLDEVYCNIFDHADAKGNSFSFIKFDKENEKLHVAVCDFGKGISRTVREKFPNIETDAEALKKAMEDNFTIGSQDHNKGMGLGNIYRTCFDNDVLRIISNNGFLYAKNDIIQVRNNNFNFSGTLIYYEVSLSHFEDEEMKQIFNLDF